jgi:GTPase
MMESDRFQLKEAIDLRLPFVSFARRYFISAKHGTGVGKLYHALEESHESSNKDLGTGFLTSTLNKALEEHQPPLINGRRIKLRIAHIIGRHPLTILIHGKQTESVPQSYQRYLASYFRKACNIMGVPLIIRFKTDDNPYDMKDKK